MRPPIMIHFSPILLFPCIIVSALSLAHAQDLPTPKVYYDFEDEITETVADKSGNERHGTYSGPVVSVPGAPQGATPASGFEFLGDGSTCVGVDYQVTEMLDTDGGYTMAAWIQPSETTGDLFLFGQANQGLHLGLRNGGLLHQAHWSDDNNAGTALVEGEWVHATWIYDRAAAEGRIYLNGVLDGTHGKGDPNVIDSTLIVGDRNGCQGLGFQGVADEIAIWSEILTEQQIMALAEGASPIGVDSGDTDGDGLPDSYEMAVAGNLADLTAEGDFDGDGRSDVEEFSLPPNTDPTKADTDGDTLGDGEELTGAGQRPPTDPLKADTDGDGLPDNVEDHTGTFVSASQTGTNPVVSNTDRVGGTDGSEVAAGTNPLDPEDPPTFGPHQLPKPQVYYDFSNEETVQVPNEAGDGMDEVRVIPNQASDAYHGVIVSGELTAGAPGGASPIGGFHFPDDGGCVVTDLHVEHLISQAGGYTMTAWLRPSDVSGQHIVLGQTNQGFHNGIRNGSVLHQAHWSDDHNAGTALVEDEWVHAAWVFDQAAGEGRMYLNGMLDAEHEIGTPNILDADLILGNRSGCEGEGPYFGDVDDIAVWSEILTDAQILALSEGAHPLGVTGPAIEITAITHGADGVGVTWTSEPGAYYGIEASPDLMAWQTVVTEFPLGGATAEESRYLESLSNAPLRFYRVSRVPPPALLREDFENGANGWTAVTDTGETLWELGTPNVDGLAAANSGTQAWGTNLAGNYAPATNAARLQSPVIDLTTRGRATLSFHYHINAIDGEGGQIRFLNEEGVTLATVPELPDIFTGQTDGWEAFSVDIPSAALQQRIIIEFAFLTNEDDVVAPGWYVDDVVVD